MTLLTAHIRFMVCRFPYVVSSCVACIDRFKSHALVSLVAIDMHDIP